MVFLSSESETPEWKSFKLPQAVKGVLRGDHTTVVLPHGEKGKEPTVVVLEGYQEYGVMMSLQVPWILKRTDDLTRKASSVFLLNPQVGSSTSRKGPDLNGGKSWNLQWGHTAMVCKGSLYVIGGYRASLEFETLQRIGVADLLETTSVNMKWSTVLIYRYWFPRYGGCAATVVHDRNILVVGGHTGLFTLSSVDIIDTAAPNGPLRISGPSMHEARTGCGIAVIGRRIYVVGGHNGYNVLNTVEYLEFNDVSHDDTSDNVSSVFPSSLSWKMHETLALNVPRRNHAIATVGSNIVVAGGFDGSSSLRSVEVLDTQRNIVWNLPSMRKERVGCSMVALSTGLVVTGGAGDDSAETLPLSETRETLLVRISLNCMYLLFLVWYFVTSCQVQTLRLVLSVEDAVLSCGT